MMDAFCKLMGTETDDINYNGTNVLKTTFIKSRMSKVNDGAGN